LEFCATAGKSNAIRVAPINICFMRSVISMSPLGFYYILAKVVALGEETRVTEKCCAITLSL
jgi:hypothetical protein